MISHKKEAETKSVSASIFVCYINDEINILLHYNSRTVQITVTIQCYPMNRWNKGDDGYTREAKIFIVSLFHVWKLWSEYITAVEVYRADGIPAR